MNNNNGLSGWSCIYCGCMLDGPADGEEHQAQGECSGPINMTPDEQAEWDYWQRKNREEWEASHRPVSK